MLKFFSTSHFENLTTPESSASLPFARTIFSDDITRTPWAGYLYSLLLTNLTLLFTNVFVVLLSSFCRHDIKPIFLFFSRGDTLLFTPKDGIRSFLLNFLWGLFVSSLGLHTRILDVWCGFLCVHILPDSHSWQVLLACHGVDPPCSVLVFWASLPLIPPFDIFIMWLEWRWTDITNFTLWMRNQV